MPDKKPAASPAKKPRRHSTRSKVPTPPRSKRKSTAAKIGRPSVYSDELADRICLAIAEGMSLNRICAAEDMPSKNTVILWLLRKNPPEFYDRYCEARAIQGEVQADEIIDIADDAANDWIETEDGPRLNYEHVQRSKLRVDARKWVGERLAPRIYGARQSIDVTARIEDMPGDELHNQINTLIAKAIGKND